jgi:hypothetical protein
VALRALGDLAGETGDFAAARMWYARLLEAEPFAEEPVRALLDRLPAPVEAVAPSPAAVLRDEQRRVERQTAATVPDAATVPEATGVPEAATAPALAPAGEETTKAAEAAVKEPVEAAREEVTEVPEDTPEGSTGELMTPTLADLYLEQGLVDEAIRIYERLMVRRPDDLGLAERLEAARARAARRPSTPQGKAGAATPDEPEDTSRTAGREEAPRGPSIRRYLDDLIEGRPGGDSPQADRGDRFERWLRAIRGV